MAMNFGKGNRSIAFNPTSAFPLDARSYFESYADAVAAAASAEAAGSTNTQYYYGQTLVVVENSKATFYIIQPDNTLSTLTSGNSNTGGEGSSTTLTVDANQFEFDDSGALILRGSKGASANSLVSINENGVLQWIDPIDTYTKEEIDTKIAATAHLNRKVVGSIAEMNAYISEHDDADLYIFMVPTGLEEDSNRYDEYIVISITDSEGDVTRYPEKIGSWEVNLSDYVKLTDFEEAMAGKVDAEDGSRLITDEEAEKLSNIEDGAQVNIIESVSEDFSIVNDETQGLFKQLQLNSIAIAKVIGLSEELANKVDVIDGYSLLSPTDKAKLDALVLGDDNNLEISGSVNAENVVGLEEWINEHQSTVDGLSENNFSDSLYTKLNNMLNITSVDQTQLSVSRGKLSVTALSKDLVTGLSEALAEKASIEELEALGLTVSNNTTTISSVANALNSLSNSVNKNTLDIADLKDALTWKDIT